MDEISGFDEDSTDWKCYRCEDCGQMFGTRSRMLCHRKMHTGERAHLCDDCGKSFTTRESLVRHRWMHSSEKPHKCDECGKSFLQRTKLKFTCSRIQRETSPM